MGAELTCRAAIATPPWALRKLVWTVTLTFDRPPSVNQLFKNVAGRGRAKTAAYSNWIAAAGMEIMVQRPGAVLGHYHLSIAAERSNKLADLDNIHKATSDILKTMGVIQEDRLCASYDARWAGKGTRITVRITSTGEPL